MNPMSPATEAFFMAAASGQRLCLYHPSSRNGLRGAVVYVHPWAEEMNKSRRMAALQSRALANAGYAVLQIDLHGCGDSSGDFADATWSGWIDDVRLAARWMQARHDKPLWIWGLRAGCLLAVQAAREIDGVSGLLFWQPAASGRALLLQFLRLKAAAELLQGGAKGTTARLRSDLEAGRGVEVAGYRLESRLALGLARASLDAPPQGCRVLWLEVSTRADATLPAASLMRIEAWRNAGHDVAAGGVHGPAFWQTQEIEDAPALIRATLAAIDSRVAA
jgi:uncharacterized protein